MAYPRVSKKFSKRIKSTKFSSRFKMFLATLAVVLLFFYFFWGEYGFFRLWILKHKISRLNSEISTLKVQQHDIIWEKEKLKKDPEYLKKYAAEHYGYARRDQTVIQFVPSDSTATEETDKEP